MSHLAVRPPTPDELYDTALTFLDVGMPETALPYLLQLASQHPSIADIHATLAKAHYESGRYDHALQAFTRAAALDPSNRALHTCMGLIHLMQQRPHDAHRALTTALHLHGNDVVTVTGLAEALIRLDRATEAVHLLETAYLTIPSDTPEHDRLRMAVILSHAYCQTERFTQARAFLSDPTLPEHPAILLYRGLAEVMTNDVHQALSSLTRAAALAPTAPRILQLLGVVQWLTGRVCRATETLTAALQALTPRDDTLRQELVTFLAGLEEHRLRIAMEIGAKGSFTDYPALYQPPLTESVTDPDRFAAYIASVTTMPGALYRALLEHGHDAIALYDAGLEAFDAEDRHTALQRFQRLFQHTTDDPVICDALFSVFDMLGAHADADAAEARRNALHDHPRIRAIRLYHQAIDALSTSDMRTVVHRLHDLELLDAAMARDIDNRLKALSHPDYAYDPHDG